MKKQKRFRASIYIDIFIDEQNCDCEIQPCLLHEKELELMRVEAYEKIQAVVKEIENTKNRNIPEEVFNPYIGGVAAYDPHNLIKPLDQEI
jgi:hypothetical protein